MRNTNKVLTNIVRELRERAKREQSSALSMRRVGKLNDDDVDLALSSAYDEDAEYLAQIADRIEAAETQEEHAKMYAVICECYYPSQHGDGFQPYIFWRSSRAVGESDLLGVYDTQKTANNELVKHARQIVDKMNRNARKFGIDHASLEEHSPGYVEVFAEYEHEDRVIWSSAYKLRVYARDFNKLIPEEADKERANAERS